MTVQGSLGTYLGADAGVVGLIDTGAIWPVRAPDGTTGNYIVYRFQDRRDLNPIDGPATLAQCVLEIESFSGNYDRAWQIAEALRTALTFFQGVMASGVDVRGCLLDNMRDDDAPEFGVFNVVSEYRIDFVI